jgi:hypothetical protein
MKLRTTLLAVLAATMIAIFSIAPAQATPPDITAVTASPTTIYPHISTVAYPATTMISFTGSNPSTVTHVNITGPSPSATIVKTIVVSTGGPVAWDGTDNTSLHVAPGTYTVYAVSTGGEPAPVTATVSGLKVINKIFTKTVKANSGVFDHYVGRCSTLRKPDMRGTPGSVGYYADTKCKLKTVKASLVSTAHAIRVPTAYSYLTEQVIVNGGAAKAQKHSVGIVRYLTLADQWVNEKVVSAPYGKHGGVVRSTSGMVSPTHYIAWGFYTGGANRYDVASFTIVVHYTVLG